MFQASLAFSRAWVMLRNSAIACRAASSGDSPRATRSAMSMSRCDFTSASTSASLALRLFHHPLPCLLPPASCLFISSLRRRWRKQIRDGLRELLPARTLLGELRGAGLGEAIHAHALLPLGDLPRAAHESLLLETMERRIQRAGVELEYVARVGANELNQPVAVPRPPSERLQDHQIQRALQECEVGIGRAAARRHGSRAL